MEPPSGSNADGPEEPGPQFVSKTPTSNPNISDVPPIKEFALLAGAAVAIFLILYLVLGSLAGWAAGHLPESVEIQIEEEGHPGAPFAEIGCESERHRGRVQVVGEVAQVDDDLLLGRSGMRVGQGRGRDGR